MDDKQYKLANQTLMEHFQHEINTVPIMADNQVDTLMKWQMNETSYTAYLVTEVVGLLIQVVGFLLQLV